MADSNHTPSESDANKEPVVKMNSTAPESPAGSVAETKDHQRRKPKYMRMGPDEPEDLEFYRKGGFHPVHIDDTFSNGRYRVLQKLGSGGFATVWLARDYQLERYVSLKIIAADPDAEFSELQMFKTLEAQASEHPGFKYIVTILDSFTFEGPNGTHTCLVSEVLGPTIGELIQQFWEASGRNMLRPELAKTFARQLTQAVACLHSVDIVHGDITPYNVLLKLRNFDHWSIEELNERLGQPYMCDVLLADGNRPTDASSPRYLVAKGTLVDPIVPISLIPEIRLIDLGVSFFATGKPPVDGTGIPCFYSPPEQILAKESSIGTDAWALACTVYYVFAGRQMFPSFFGSVTPILTAHVQILGKLPEHLWNMWEKRTKDFDEDGKHKNGWSATIKSDVDHIGSNEQDKERCEKRHGNDQWQLDDWMLRCGDTLDNHDKDGLCSFLGRLFKMDPNDRSNTKDMASDAWLNESTEEAITALRKRLDDEINGPGDDSDLEPSSEVIDRHDTPILGEASKDIGKPGAEEKARLKMDDNHLTLQDLDDTRKDSPFKTTTDPTVPTKRAANESPVASRTSALESEPERDPNTQHLPHLVALFIVLLFCVICLPLVGIIIIGSAAIATRRDLDNITESETEPARKKRRTSD